jgi:hypothetical protein
MGLRSLAMAISFLFLNTLQTLQRSLDLFRLVLPLLRFTHTNRVEIVTERKPMAPGTRSDDV